MKRWMLGAVLATVGVQAVAADFSLRSECARKGGRYEAAKRIDAVSSLLDGRFGADTVNFRVSGTNDYYGIGRAYNAEAAELVKDAFDKQKKVNLCLRDDSYTHGVEMTSD